MGPMSLLAPLLSADAASPRLTVYDETAGTRMEFSATTLDNWANKIANLLVEEFELDDPSAGPSIVVDLPVSWQAAVLPIGIYAAGLAPVIDTTQSDPRALLAAAPRLVFTSLDRVAVWAGSSSTDVVVVSDDPFGRGVVESGGTLPAGAIDFGPTVRFYGDQYFGPSPDLGHWLVQGVADARLLIPGWTTREKFDNRVMAPLAAGGSVVAVRGMCSAERLEHIAEAEKVTQRL